MNRFFFLPIIIIGLSLSIIPAFASPSLSISPTSGPVATTITASGAGFTPSPVGSQNHTSGVATTTGWKYNLYAQNYSGITAGAQITNVALKFKTINNGTTSPDNLCKDSTTAGWMGNVYTSKFVSLTPNSHLSNVALNVTTAAGNVRVKAYQDDGVGGNPSTLLGETGSIAVGGTGIQNFPISATVPASGNMWVAFETTSNLLDLRYRVTAFDKNGGSCESGSDTTAAHVYGSGPSPFGAVTGLGFSPQMILTLDAKANQTQIRLKVYNDTAGSPSNLLYETNAIKPNATGVQNFAISTTAPNVGKIWLAMETNDRLLELYYKNIGAPLSVYTTPHTFGSGPNPFGSVTAATSQFWSFINYTTSIAYVSFNWDGFPVSTTPSNPQTDSLGAFSGVTFTVPSSGAGAHIVQAQDTSSLTASSVFTVTANTLPYVTDLHYIALSNNAVSLAWSTPPINNNTSFHGYQIRFTTPYGTPNTILVNNTNSSSTAYNIAGLTANTQYSFQIGTWANSTDFYTLANVLNFQTLSSTPPTLTPGNLNLNYTTNPNHVGYQFFRQNVNASAVNLFVGYPNTYNTTCNLNYEFANTNHTYYNLSNTPNGTGRVKAEFQFLNLGNEIVNTVCRDVLTNDTGHYTITNSITTIPLVQQVQNFENGVYGTAGQFGAFDLIELIVIIISTIALNRVNETVGAIIMIFVIAGLAFFHIGSFPVIIFSAIAMIIVLTVSTTKRLAFSP